MSQHMSPPQPASKHMSAPAAVQEWSPKTSGVKTDVMNDQPSTGAAAAAAAGWSSWVVGGAKRTTITVGHIRNYICHVAQAPRLGASTAHGVVRVYCTTARMHANTHSQQLHAPLSTAPPQHTQTQLQALYTPSNINTPPVSHSM